MAEFAALPLFTDALLADTGHLSDAEFGLYMRLLVLLWRSPDCQVPNDKAWIAKRLGRTPLQFEGEIAPIIAEFCQTDGNFISQKRLFKEFEYVKKNRKAQSGRAVSKWAKIKSEKTAEKKSVPDKALKQKELDLSPSDAPSPSPSPSIEDIRISSLPPTPKAQKASPKIAEEQLPEWVPKKEFTDFIEYRKKIRKPMTPTAIKLAIKKLETLKAEGQAPADVLNQSIMNGWTGLFEVKGNYSNAIAPISGNGPARKNGPYHQPKASYMDKIANAGEKAGRLVKARMDADSNAPWNQPEPSPAGGHLSDLSGERKEKPDGA